MPVVRCLRTAKAHDWKTLVVMSWGGLRGAVSLALAISVNRDPRIDQKTIGSKVLTLHPKNP